MTSTQTAQLTADIHAILHQGGNALTLAKDLASLRGVSADEVVALAITLSGSPRQIHQEDLAQERLADDRRAARIDGAAYRESQHEET